MSSEGLPIKVRSRSQIRTLTLPAVSESKRSVAFYKSLGLSMANRSISDDPAQTRLDHLVRSVVEVIAMAADRSAPHLELLCYRKREDRRPIDLRENDVAATCLLKALAGPVVSAASMYAIYMMWTGIIYLSSQQLIECSHRRFGVTLSNHPLPKARGQGIPLADR
jgi:hypothetical protein